MLIKHQEKIYKVWWKHKLPKYSVVYRTLIENGETQCFIQQCEIVDDKVVTSSNPMHIGVAKLAEKDQYKKSTGRKLSFQRCLSSIADATADIRKEYYRQYKEQLPKDFI